MVKHIIGRITRNSLLLVVVVYNYKLYTHLLSNLDKKTATLELCTSIQREKQTKTYTYTVLLLGYGYISSTSIYSKRNSRYCKRIT